MFTSIARALILLTLGAASIAFATPDKRGCTDHPLLPTRMPDYFLSDCQTRDFDAYDFFVTKGPRHREEGKFFFITYQIEKGKTEQSALAIVRNYENAITKIGGTIVASDQKNWVNGKVVVDGREIWLQAERGNGKIWLRIVEKAPMKQHIVADAAAFANDLKATGHVAVYGIFFDTGKSVVKPESKAAIDEVAKLLKSDAALRLWVVGHTDSVGKVEDNMRLAQARAEAVAAELTGAYGIPAARLKGYGVGPLSPVAGNDSEEGRAKNRRVDLVKQP
ncbi:MAG TPA: OmpA family protein [Usitatibacteraceae bacterium]|nr:OmpA family protein [Usitatibacteraceae bacterium]